MDARIDSEELYCFLKGCDRVVLFLNKEQEADKETEEAYFKLIDIRAARVPLQHITGTQEFMGFEFKVGPEVLIPRQETEILVTEAARTQKRSSCKSTKARQAVPDVQLSAGIRCAGSLLRQRRHRHFFG